MALVRSKIKKKNSEGACQKTTLGCCVEDTYRVIRGEIYNIVGMGNSLYAKYHSRECALPIKKILATPLS